jgi:hypothetical protein
MSGPSDVGIFFRAAVLFLALFSCHSAAQRRNLLLSRLKQKTALQLQPQLTRKLYFLIPSFTGAPK